MEVYAVLGDKMPRCTGINVFIAARALDLQSNVSLNIT